MIPDLERTHGVLLGIALDDEVHPDWIDVRMIGERAAKEGLLLHFADWCEARGIVLPSLTMTSVRFARTRAIAVEAVVARIASHFALQRSQCVFTKLMQGAPDVGRDLDLLVADDRVELPTVESPIPIDVSREALGAAGEHRRLALDVLARAVPGTFRGAHCLVPCPDDQLLLLVLRCRLARPALRLSDVCAAARLLSTRAVDSTRVIESARACGILGALGCHLDGVDQIVFALRGTPLLDHRWREQLPVRRWGRVRHHAGRFYLASRRATARVYGELVATSVHAHDWRSVARIARLPFLALARRARSLTHVSGVSADA